MSKYADVLKPAKDLLSKSFNYDNKVELKSTADNGTNFVTEATFGKNAGAILKADFPVGKFKMDKLQIGTDKKVIGEMSLANAFPNTKLTFKATDGSRASGADAITAIFGAEYKLNNGMLTLDVDALGLKVDTTGLFSANNVLFGYNVKAGKGKDGSFGLTDYNVLAGYKNSGYTVAAQTDKKLANLTVGVHHNVKSSTAIAAVAKLPVQGAGNIDVEFGFSYKADASTTYHSKINSNGKIAFSVGQVISPLAKLTVATEFDATNIASDDQKFGLNLSLTA